MFKNKENNNLEVENNQPQNNSLNKGQKIAVVSLAFFAFFIVILWSVQFKNSISGGPVIDTSNNEEAINNTINTSQVNDLTNKDSDGDGLSDSDELNIYLTSPYLEDSDSDGFSDKEEIESGNDPLCPQGVDCYGADSPYNNESGVKDTNNTGNTLLDQLNINENANVSQEAQLESFLSGQVDAASLRSILIESGMDKNMLDQISDDDLMKSYREMLENNLSE